MIETTALRLSPHRSPDGCVGEPLPSWVYGLPIYTVVTHTHIPAQTWHEARIDPARVRVGLSRYVSPDGDATDETAITVDVSDMDAPCLQLGAQWTLTPGAPPREPDGWIDGWIEETNVAERSS